MFAAEIKNLSVVLSGKTILKNINLKIEDGSFTVITGANGTGKSTLIKTLCGLQKYSGAVKILGRDLKKTDRSVIGYVPQNNVSERTCPLSVFEAVSIGRHAKNGLLKKFSEKDGKIVRNALKISGIENIKDSLVGKISGGQSQKISIARVIVQRPRIIFLDEPQAGLDMESKKDFLNLTERLYKKFKFTCVMVTHDLDDIPSFCKKILKLENSEISET
ncbi:MAG: ATP-binding cassette domain-containing protein [Endomicrobia bacterium]|nr:ATP-binding cassette domain-containing protein [Endomicrobiia bacterium]MCL2799187.1 ATP-binding cassette domain-containing protein [Endomicrobiia bacterium]